MSRFLSRGPLWLPALLLCGALLGMVGRASAQPVAEAPSRQPEANAPAHPAPAQPKPDQSALGEKWIRLEKDEAGKPTAMQTAVVRYGGPIGSGRRPVTVDLIGAVHVGDAAYYAELNRRFGQYDALLYELVAPQGTRVPRGAKAETRNPLGAIQGGMKTMLELEHQLEKVDYTRRNFVHADMSPQEFFDSMEKRDEGVVQMIFKMMGQSMAMQSEQEAKGESADAEILVALFAKDRARRLKIVMAKQFNQMESLLTSFGGEKGSTIITERNKKALEVLRRELKAGKSKLGIFYGAGHLLDMHRRVVKDFGLRPQSIEWITAWDLK